MARRCSVCAHPDVADINAQIAEGGRPIRGISQVYALSEDSLARHRKNHLPKIAVAAATDERQYDHHRKLLVLEKTLYTVLTRRLKDADDGMVLKAHGQLLRHYEFELKLGAIEEVRKDLEELKEEIDRREIER